MNAVSIAILAAVVTLCALALRSAFKRDGGSCSCCSQKGSCPYSGSKECHCKD